MAGFGVTLFFVISGFLITYLLLLEKDEGNVNIKNFYMRRILRIWPIYYLFIGICLLVGLLSKNLSDIFSTNIWWYLFFTANIPFILIQGIKILVHYWSIGVEEQFYLFWPWVVKFSTKKLLVISISIFVFLFGIKSCIWLLYGKGDIIYQTLSVIRFHCMMIGAIGAILYKSRNALFHRIILNKWLQLASWFIFIATGVGIFHIPAPIAHEIIALVSLALIMGQVTTINNIINLDRKLPDFLGKISYGIYIIHPLVIFLLSPVFRIIEINLYAKYILVYVAVFACTITLAWLSYEFYEKPFLSLKSRFSTIFSANTKHIQKK